MEDKPRFPAAAPLEPATGAPAEPPDAADLEARAADLRRRLEKAVWRVCPSWDAASREDLVQAAMIRLLERMGSAEGERPLSASYLRKTAYSVLVDELRRRRRRSEVPLPEEPYRAPQAAGPAPERQVESRQLGEAIRECLRRLVEARRLAVVLYLEGHGTPEVSQLLAWSRKRAENSIYRGLADLRQCLAGKGWSG